MKKMLIFILTLQIVWGCNRRENEISRNQVYYENIVQKIIDKYKNRDTEKRGLYIVFDSSIIQSEKFRYDSTPIVTADIDSSKTIKDILITTCDVCASKEVYGAYISFKAHKDLTLVYSPCKDYCNYPWMNVIKETKLSEHLILFTDVENM